MKKKHLVILVLALFVVVVGLSIYLLWRGQPDIMRPPLTQTESNAYAQLANDPDLFVGRVIYTADGFDPPRIGVIAPKPPVALVTNNSDIVLQLENIDAPEGAAIGNISEISVGEVGKIELQAEGKYVFVNQADSRQQFEMEYQYKARQDNEGGLSDQLLSYRENGYGIAQNRYTLSGFEKNEIEIDSTSQNAVVEVENLSEEVAIFEVTREGGGDTIRFGLSAGVADVFELSEYGEYIVRDTSRPELNFFTISFQQ